MSQIPDFKLDGEIQELFFKSSDGKLFSVSKIRAMESRVWKDMLEVGKDQQEQCIITLSEDSETLLRVFKAMNAKDFLLKFPEELQDLKADTFIALAEAATKYEVELISAFLLLESKKRLCPKADEMKGWQGFEQDGWDITSIMRFFLVVKKLGNEQLIEAAAKMTLLIPDIILDQTEETLKMISYKEDLAPLYSFRLRWTQIKADILRHTWLGGVASYSLLSRSLNFSLLSDEESVSRSSVDITYSNWDVAARKLDQALLDLKYHSVEGSEI